MIRLYGSLAKKFPKESDIIVHSVAEVVKAMDANYKGFRRAIKKDRNYVVVRGDSLKKGTSIHEEEVDMTFSDTNWHILPVPLGYGGDSGFLNIIGGIVLIVVGVYVSPFAPMIGQALIGMGAGMVLGGLSQLLAPSPPTFDYESRESPDERPSYLFDGPTNSIEPGLTIPVVYGESFIGSIFISGGLTIENI